MPGKENKSTRSAARKPRSVKPFIQGEGDYVSARRHQAEAHRFAREHDTEALARAAAPKNEAERREMAEAERKGKSRAKGRPPLKKNGR